MKQPYTERQFNYAVAIKCALDDNADILSMDKWEMRDYISRALSDPESKRRINEYNAKMWAHDREMRRLDRQRERKCGRAWLSDESLGADWGLDASDFGAQAWGDS